MPRRVGKDVVHLARNILPTRRHRVYRPERHRVRDMERHRARDMERHRVRDVTTLPVN
jgi:hypothetical protein